MSRQPIGWYARRLRRMSGREVVWRVRDHALRTAWATQQVRPGRPPRGRVPVHAERLFTAPLPAGAAATVPAEARQAVVDLADEILAGDLDVLGAPRTDLKAPDWFYDPATGRRSDPTQFAFGMNFRSEEQVGNVKQVWELSRHHHLTQLAAAWLLTGDDAYAERVAEQLRSWWRENPFLSGVHWTSGIEAGIRLISWAWIRRLLADWPPVAELFEDNEEALWQIYWHQRYLAAFRSRGSSANNHVIAEAAGLLVASCAFPWYERSAKWRGEAARLLERELCTNTFPSGVNRELASDYHRFVAELGLLAAVEAGVAGHPLSPQTWTLLTSMLDAAAALVDASLRPPRQGDDDEGRALAIDPSDPARWSNFLSLGAALVGPVEWWPRTPVTSASALVGALAGPPHTGRDRPQRRPSHFADAGLTVLRTSGGGSGPEIWCRCDGGPHGFLSIAAHAHADALSVEVRVGGVDVLADPGTYCYHGEQEWRGYFRSTLAHNTIEVAGRGQSTAGGPFLWLRHATGRVLDVAGVDADGTAVWKARHDGYLSLDPPVVHQRTVSLDRAHRTLFIADRLGGTGARGVRMAYHLGPDVDVELSRNRARLSWPGSAGQARGAAELPTELEWTVHRGETNPVLGWYSPRFGHKVPAATLVGTGPVEPATTLVTKFEFPC